MVTKTRAQDDDPKGKGIDTEESEPRWFTKFLETNERRQETNDRRLSRLEAMVADFLDRSRKEEKENPEDQICNDEELTEIEAETKSSGIEDRAVENEANSDVISASVKKEQIPQIQVPTSKLERGLQIHYVSPTVCEDSQYVVGCDELFGHQEAMLHVSHVEVGDELLTKSTSVTNNQVTHQLFDEIPLRKGILPKEHKERFHKSWRFKFKHSVAPRDSKSVSDVLRTTLGPSSMLKMLLEAVGIVVTTDGNAILLEIDVANPAAKSMIELSHTQDEEVGVGITSVIVLAGELSQPIDVKDRATVLGVVKKLEMRFMTSKQQVLLLGMKPGSVGEIRAQKLNKIQQCRLSLRAIRVWDPGGSNSETDCLKA